MTTSLSVLSVTQPTHGTAVANIDSVSYTPQADYQGIDSFSYTVSDEYGSTDTAIVNITVLPTLFNIHLPLVIHNWPPVVLINDAPDYCQDAYSITAFERTYLDNFDKEIDPDWYRFEAAKGATYVVDVVAGANIIPVLRLYNNECKYMELQGVPIENGTRLLWEHGWASGWYHLLVYEGHGRFGADTSYTLSIQESP